MPMKVILLGTGGPRPDPRRMATTTLIRRGDENILFDAGRGVTLRLVQAGVPLASLGPVFLTHHHFDHIGDLYDVVLNTWLAGRRTTLDIYGPPETERVVDALLTQVYDKDIGWRSAGEPTFGGFAPVAVTDVVAGPVLDTGRWRIRAETVSHGDGLGIPPAFMARWTCLGYRFEADGKVIAISGDTVACDGLARLAEGADLLVQCCFLASPEIQGDHFRRLAKHTLACGDTVGRIAAAAGVKTLALTHHRPRGDDAMLKALADEVARDFSGRLVIGEDLTEIEV
ncbi:MBL fold metallo-hydrolase [Rhodoplanes sp. TEM]|uniref:MBL fold metallo-hydrolase n=1 Tax=Rhodoplanes tepidamans TaxID=200616 RepID=A0ABT5JCP7_RHOTP|nr:MULTISPECIES: MBL fold metallo-hydrolase [Rhodoplanes]MDC7786830.1 MBL fold metallo-hydrolase [Rhodoplanes tepidamans]MDC7985970.1 MBL fold metallo-hydrolase [Rhodoplanes sp. TEM]MDQ0355958.1 ribonuclease Z [Rhodoplanes tepidamans]